MSLQHTFAELVRRVFHWWWQKKTTTAASRHLVLGPRWSPERFDESGLERLSFCSLMSALFPSQHHSGVTLSMRYHTYSLKPLNEVGMCLEINRMCVCVCVCVCVWVCGPAVKMHVITSSSVRFHLGIFVACPSAFLRAVSSVCIYKRRSLKSPSTQKRIFFRLFLTVECLSFIVQNYVCAEFDSSHSESLNSL